MPQKLKNGRWRIQWTDAAGRRCSENYATLAHAKIALRRHENEKDLRRALGRPHRVTLSAVYGHWITHRQKRSIEYDKLLWGKHIGPAFGNCELEEIDQFGVDLYIKQKLSELSPRKIPLSPSTVNTHLRFLRALINCAIQLRWANPLQCLKVKLLRVNDKRMRYLTKEEIGRFLAESKKEKQMTHALFLTALITGMRAGELGALKWSNVNLDEKKICVCESWNSGTTKSGRVRYIPISKDLQAILKALPRPNEFVFLNADGTPLKPSGRVFEQMFQRVCRRAKIEGAVFHTLRHTMATQYMASGGNVWTLKGILGHASVTQTEVYAKNVF